MYLQTVLVGHLVLPVQGAVSCDRQHWSVNRSLLAFWKDVEGMHSMPEAGAP